MVRQRNLSLDVFRGMTICFMIIVNTPGDSEHTFSPLLHARWHGFTPTDLVFPSFLFAVGNAMSFGTYKWESQPAALVTWKILKRAALIFLLGYLMYWFPFFRLDEAGHVVSFPISHTRIMGVLQRIGLCYGIAALMIYYLRVRATVIITVFLLLLYWILLFAFGTYPDPLALLHNAPLRLDHWLMGDNHLYHGEGVPFDPEGWLSTLPAIGNVVGGYLAGKWIQKHGNTYEGIFKLLLAGSILVVTGYFWDLLLPINKKLWTSSFVVYTVGLDCCILSVLTFITQIQGKIQWANFFQVFGKNPLSIYLFSELLVIVLFMIPVGDKSLFRWIYDNIFSYAGFYWGSLLFAISYMLVCWLLGYWMDKRKIYIRV